MKLKKEIAAIINIIQCHLGIIKKLDQSLFTEINWDRFEKALTYHALRPMAFEQFQKSTIEIPSNVQKMFVAFAQNQAIAHLSNTLEVERLKKLFKENDIKMLPFKGVVYQNDFYKNGLRESGDIDLLIKPAQLKETIPLLLKDGYQFSLDLKNYNTEEICKDLLKAKELYEFPFNKSNHHIDLHWDVHYGFLPYEIPKDFILELENNIDQIFWTMLNHHGGKEFWLKLKDLVDFAAFTQKYQDELDWEILLSQACAFKMETVLLNGFYLLKNILSMEIPEYMEKKISQIDFSAYVNTLSFWNEAKHWSNPIVRFKFEIILIQSQDSGFSKKLYFKNFYIAYTKPNPAEQRRFLTFPKKFHFLNFLSKVFSYSIKKTFGIK
jgi:hypothetical protein